MSDTNAALKVVQLPIKALPQEFLKAATETRHNQGNFDMHSRLSPPAVPAADCSAKPFFVLMICRGLLCYCPGKAEVAHHTFISKCSHFSQQNAQQHLTEKKYNYYFMPEEKVIIFPWLFLGVLIPNRE